MTGERPTDKRPNATEGQQGCK